MTIDAGDQKEFALEVQSGALTHQQLVEIAKRWLKRTFGCPLITTEMVTKAGEIPDAIGWSTYGDTILVECKTSRSDFRAEQRSKIRGLGGRRFYLAPQGVIPVDQLPEGYGLLEVTARGVRVVKLSHPVYCICAGNKPRECLEAFKERSHRGEAIMLLSLIRRLAGPGVRGKATVEIDPYTNDEHGQPVKSEGMG